MNPCSQYSSERNECISGHIPIHAACWGGNTGCPACGKTDSLPPCMQEERPAHLVRPDGYPMNWPDAKVKP